jgi:hypothetical protein
MKSLGRAASAVAFVVRAIKPNSFPPKRALRSGKASSCRSIGILAIVSCAMLFLSLGAAQAVGTGATTINVQSSLNPSGVGQHVTFTVSVQGVNTGVIPSGTITLMEGGNTLGSGSLTATPTGATVQIPVTFNTGGAHNISAVYSGDATFAGNSAAFTQNVLAPTSTNLISSANPSQVNQSVTFTATVTSSTAGTPTGTVTFTDGTSTLGGGPVTLSPGGSGTQAQLTVSFPAISTHNINATYNGDSTFVGSGSSTLVQQV